MSNWSWTVFFADFLSPSWTITKDGTTQNPSGKMPFSVRLTEHPHGAGSNGLEEIQEALHRYDFYALFFLEVGHAWQASCTDRLCWHYPISLTTLPPSSLVLFLIDTWKFTLAMTRYRFFPLHALFLFGTFNLNTLKYLILLKPYFSPQALCTQYLPSLINSSFPSSPFSQYSYIHLPPGLKWTSPIVPTSHGVILAMSLLHLA